MIWVEKYVWFLLKKNSLLFITTQRKILSLDLPWLPSWVMLTMVKHPFWMQFAILASLKAKLVALRSILAHLLLISMDVKLPLSTPQVTKPLPLCVLVVHRLLTLLFWLLQQTMVLCHRPLRLSTMPKQRECLLLLRLTRLINQAQLLIVFVKSLLSMASFLKSGAVRICLLMFPLARTCISMICLRPFCYRQMFWSSRLIQMPPLRAL